MLRRFYRLYQEAHVPFFAAALAYRWAQEPKIERQLYGCTAKWDAKAQTCKGKWVPLYEQQP